MKVVRFIQSHLHVKYFLSFIIVMIVFIGALIAAVEFILPNAFNQHLEFMSSILSEEGQILKEHNLNLYASFRTAIYKSLQFALPISMLAFFFISVFFSREFVRPIKELSRISQKICEGKFDQRIALPEKLSLANMDELRQLAVNFNQMASRLENTEQLRRQLIGDVSHELRTPIALISATMEGLIDGIVPRSNKTFYQVQVEAERLAKLIYDLQELSIIESGTFQIVKEKNNMNEVISAVIGNLAPQFIKKEIQIITDFQESGIDARFDINRLKQVLTNILTNAYRYSHKGGLVTIKSISSADEIQVLVSDSGIGISREDLPYIFTRFFRADKSRSRNSGGSGIGLTIAKHIVESHGGRIWAHSPGENKGATIGFSLPKY